MTMTHAEVDNRHVFEANGWAVLCHTTLFRMRYVLAVRTSDGELTTCDGRYDEPLAFLLARFDPRILEDLDRCLDLDRPRRGEEPDPTWETRAEAIARIHELAHADEAEPMYIPVPFLEGAGVFGI